MKKGAARGVTARPWGYHRIYGDAGEGGWIREGCLLREGKEVGAPLPPPECERFRRHRDGEWLLIDAYRAQAAGASPGIDEVAAMKLCEATALHLPGPACPALVAVMERADPETGPRAHFSLRRSLPPAYGEVLRLVQQQMATYEEYVLRRSATAASVRD